MLLAALIVLALARPVLNPDRESFAGTGPLLLGDNPTRTPARLTRYGVDYLVRRAAERSGVSKPVTVNVLRNTRAITWSPGGESNS